MKKTALSPFALAACLLPQACQAAPAGAPPHRNPIPIPRSSPPSPPWIDARQFGTRGDGRADDTAAIQAALDAAAKRGGGTVLLRSGTYLISPSIKTRLVLRSNVHVLGEGTGTVLKVRDNAGDFETIFGAETNGTPVAHVSIRNLTIDQNPSGNKSCDIQVGNRSKSQFAIAFSRFRDVTVEGVRFDPASGVNTVVLSGPGTEEARVLNCYFRFVQAASRTPNYDNSAVYLECKGQLALGNLFVAEIGQRARGAIETHNGLSVITGNVTDGYQTGVNVVTAYSEADVRENNDITVVGNSFSRANHAIKLWSGTHRTLKNVTIADNTISLSQVDFNDPSSSGIMMVYDSRSGSLDGSYDSINIHGNTITFQDEASGRSWDRRGAALDAANCCGIDLAPAGNISNVLVSGNIITRAPVRGIRLGNQVARNLSQGVRISSNLITDAGQNSAVVSGYRAAISLEGALVDVAVSNNSIVDSGRGYQSIYAHPTSAVNVSIRGNQISARHGSLRYDVDRTKGIDADEPPKEGGHAALPTDTRLQHRLPALPAGGR